VPASRKRLTPPTIFSLIAAIALTAACGGGGDGGFPEDFDQDFMESCIAQSSGAVAGCRCALDNLHERYDTYAEFIQSADYGDLYDLTIGCEE
jgi:hypothetical protein